MNSICRAHWHGEIVVRMITPNPKSDSVEFLNQFKNQVKKQIISILSG